jgi:5-methyltetrahydropteroyltriglutamate--homocysteine methyltransferase
MLEPVAPSVQPRSATQVIRAENVGSLLRPPELLQAQAALARGEIDHGAFKALEDRSVDEVVALQKRAAIGVITDGELRRRVFASGLVQDSDGFRSGVEGNTVEWRRLDGSVERSPVTVAVASRIERKRLLSTEEFAYLRARVGSVPTKVAVPSSTMFAYYWYPPVSEGAYPSPLTFLEHVTELLRDEVAALVQLGCPYVQVDAPELGMLLDPQQRAWFEAKGFEPDRLVHAAAELIDAILEPCAGVARTGLHVCRGNDANRYMARGGYERIAEAVFPRTRADVLLLEYDDERSGGFEPLRHVPDDRTIVLGLVSTKRPALERTGEVRERIQEAASVVGLERLALSAQCGFASVARGNDLSASAQEAKLKLVAEIAAQVWDDA